MWAKVKPNVLMAVFAISAICIWGASHLIDADKVEHAVGLLVAGVVALAALLKALTDPDIPTVPASVVMKMLDQDAGGEEFKSRFEVRPNAMLGLLSVVVMTLVGGIMIAYADNVDLAFGVFMGGIAIGGAMITDLIKPADKDVPLPLAEKVASMINPTSKAE